MTSETKELPMKIRIRPAGELLRLNERIDASGWDLLFEARISEEASRLEAAKR